MKKKIQFSKNDGQYMKQITIVPKNQKANKYAVSAPITSVVNILRYLTIPADGHIFVINAEKVRY